MPVMALACAGLDIEVAGRCLVRDLVLAIPAGSVTCLLGRNGSGKTLTLHTFARLRASPPGTIQVDGRPLENWPRRAYARQVALLPQDSADPFPGTVLETVLIGRHPHIGAWQWEGPADLALARATLGRMGLEGFADREVASLSGGERRRVAIAAALVQDPQVLLLDEPSNHLDLHHQIDVLRLLRARADAGGTVIMSLHDAGQAARFADAALLLYGDGTWLQGPAAEVLTAEHLERLYGTPIEELTWPPGSSRERTFVAV